MERTRTQRKRNVQRKRERSKRQRRAKDTNEKGRGKGVKGRGEGQGFICAATQATGAKNARQEKAKCRLRMRISNGISKVNGIMIKIKMLPGTMIGLLGVTMTGVRSGLVRFWYDDDWSYWP